MSTGVAEPALLHAWALCLRASEEARRRGDRRTGTDHLLVALVDDPSVAALLGVTQQQARDALDALDDEVLGALGLDAGPGAPPLARRDVPAKPTLRDLARRDRLRITPAAKRVLEQASKPNRRKLQLTGTQVLAQLLALEPPDPAAALFAALGVDREQTRRRLT